MPNFVRPLLLLCLVIWHAGTARAETPAPVETAPGETAPGETAPGEIAPVDTLPSVAQRFAATEANEVPDFRRHISPLLGRSGCNGRACHGSFQGQGGFRLSLFGYDLDADRQALVGGKQPRVDLQTPPDSLVLQKPTLSVDHEGGERFASDSWQYRLIARWIAGGAAAPAAPDVSLRALEIVPNAIEFASPGQTAQLRIVACWSDGSREDVTCLSRVRTNDESVATVDDNGRVTSVRPGDTHVVVFYDNAVQPIGVLSPLSDLVGPRYPLVATHTEIDRLVVDKLGRLGVVPSDVCGDAEFLRRVSLDISGTLPTASEIDAFLADAGPDKRDRKIDELLGRPGYAAWWTTRLCDYTGNNPEQLNEGPFDGQRVATQWYQWIYQRVAENRPYDEIVAGIVLGTSRDPNASFDDYCHRMNGCFKDEAGEVFSSSPSLPYYWLRRNQRKPEQMAEGFAYAFLGVRLQCAQCHKHPFDQWTKRDYEEFTALFRRVRFGVSPESKTRFDEVQAQFKQDGKKNVDFRKEGAKLIAEDALIPWREVFVAPPAKPKNKPGAAASQAPVEPGRLLEGDLVDLSRYPDPRQALLDWLRQQPERYFARALVNRVWAGYFQRGIVDPPDDLSRANPPSNEPLLDYLTRAFIEHHYDMKWLHRTIATSQTYQRSWQPNETNALDTRNFSRAVPRRLPAEVAYNSLLQASAKSSDVDRLPLDPKLLATGPPAKGKLAKANYALAVFGRPPRAVACDCERSTEPSLLQTLFLQNDGDLESLLGRPDGWLQEVTKTRGGSPDPAALVREAFLRTLSRPPTDQERQRSLDYFQQAPDLRSGLHDLLWALVNTKEFILNH